jgi:hypothetical protein
MKAQEIREAVKMSHRTFPELADKQLTQVLLAEIAAQLATLNETLEIYTDRGRVAETVAEFLQENYPTYGAGERLSMPATIDVVSAVFKYLKGER